MLKPIKVAHVIPDLDLEIVGGVGVFLRTLLSSMDIKRIENTVVTFKSQSSDRQFFLNLGIPVFTYVPKVKENPLDILEWAIELFKKLQPDIVHTNIFWGDTLGREAANRAKIKTIFSTENNINLDETPRQKIIKRKLANITDCIICPSQAVKDYSHRVEGIPENRLEVITYGIVLDNYPFQLPSLQSPAQEFIFIARLEPQKVPLRAMEAFATIVKEYPDCRLSFVGDGSLKQECQEQVLKLGLKDKVEFLGYQAQPWEKVNPGSIFLMSSDFEGLPIAVLEAMATGHLCVVPDLAGIPEMLDPILEGIIYPGGDLAGLIEAMRTALTLSPKDYLAKIVAARSRLEQNFDLKCIAEKYTSLYERFHRSS
jgi:glycosyltransferase involved in cell wall biosynthesis